MTARPAFELADVFRRHGETYAQLNAGHLGRVERRVTAAIATCRTAALGGHVELCDDCGLTHFAYNSCRNRHCPKCQGAARVKWLAARQAELLPVPYFHVVFTLPPAAAEIAFQNKRTVYGLLMRAAAQALSVLAAKRLGTTIGLIAVLHTWGQTLTHHPHVHCLVPGGGVALDNKRRVDARRRAIELAIGEEDLARLVSIARSRTEPASRVERARMLLAYREDPSFFAVGQALGVHHQTVQRCVERALAYGPMAALDDRPRPGKEPTITAEAKTWLVSLACRKAKDLGYPHELWTTRLLARHAREHGPAEGHACLGKLVQGTVCKILNEQEVKPHKVRYYLERRDPEFKAKMAEVLCVYREVKILKETAAASKKKPSDAVAIVSYDEKPGIQAIATTAPDLPPEPGAHATFARDHEYKRHGTVSLLAGIDLSPARFTLWSRTATAAANSSNSSSFSTPPIQPTRRSS